MPPVTNQEIAAVTGKRGLGKMGSAFISVILATYIINQASLHGVDFTLLGIPSEMIKSSLEALIATFIVWATPSHFVASIVDAIIFLKTSFRQIRQAWNSDEVKPDA